MIGQRTNGITQAVNNFFQSSKHFIPESTLADFFPNLFDGIHFRGVRRDVKKDDIFRQHHGLGFMPRSTVAAQQDHIVWKLTRQFPQKQIHAHSIAIRHDKKAGISSKRLHSSVGISVFPDVVTGYTWTDSFFAPTVFRLVNSAKPRFVLEHQAHFSTILLAIVDFFTQFLYFFFNFFEAAMSSSVAFLGCLLRGMTLRHPCRCKTQ